MRRPGEGGQALILLLGALTAIVLGAVVLGAVALGLGRRADRQSAADLAALAGARAMRDAYPRLFVPPLIDDRPNPDHLERAAYLALGVAAAQRTAQANGATAATVTFPAADPIAPTRIRVVVTDRIAGGEVPIAVTAEADLAPGSGAAGTGATGDEYAGPYATRQGKLMRPDVAMAFDRMQAAARADGVTLTITSAFRSNADQARLFAEHPDPKYVARPGTSLHRLGTELDLGPASAYAWLAANAGRFHFVQRYSWEPWHYGYTLNAASSNAVATAGDGSAARTAAGFVPERYAPLFASAAQRWNVSAAILAAQAYAESAFNPFARSPAGALGISQLMPATARALGVADPTDPAQAIDGQAHLMRDLLRQFASLPLALAAYNAGPARVAACMCVPQIAETQAYVAKILGLLGGAGEVTAATGGLSVRLVR